MQASYKKLKTQAEKANFVKDQYSKGMIKLQAIRKLGGVLELTQAVAAGEVVTKEDSGLKPLLLATGELCQVIRCWNLIGVPLMQ